MKVVKAAAVQISPVLYSREGTVEKIRMGHLDSVLFRDGAGSRGPGRQSKRYRAPAVDE